MNSSKMSFYKFVVKKLKGYFSFVHFVFKKVFCLGGFYFVQFAMYTFWDITFLF